MKQISWFKGLRIKLATYFLILSIVPAISIGGLSYSNSKKSLEKDAESQLAFVRDSKKREI